MPLPPGAAVRLAGLDRGLDAGTLDDLTALRVEFTRFMLQYQFGIDEVSTKISILREEFRHLHDYNPIEHVSARLKSPDSLIAKVARKGCDPSFAAIRENITDIAGIRVTCSFTSDVYRVRDMLAAQSDITVLDVKDYVAEPKPNGYRSLHVLLEIPVFLSRSVVPVTVEVQIRTIAMDFWASLEHKIYYKYDKEVPDDVLADLREAAEQANRLDDAMEGLHRRVHGEVDLSQRADYPLVPDDDVLQRLRSIRALRDPHGPTG
ncbi:GTP pyrophosphokinase family protein [Actinotalea sp. BY-33]|uniref:GTP pyrophosphokinase family protein n=2 Tax=Actinotalea soli TaxID=2819234 RepID=A0A939LRS1_9CELL|nr:GTP pyrophosphokinase family protein [Actinotalea soli]